MCSLFSCCKRNFAAMTSYQYPDADEFTYQLCTWVKKSPQSDLKVYQTLDSFPPALVYKTVEEARSAGRIDLRLHCELEHDVPDCGFVIELNIYRSRLYGREQKQAGPWMLTERISGKQQDIIAMWR